MARAADVKNAHSALQQAGIGECSFKAGTLILEEILPTAIVRVHSLTGQPFAGSAPFDFPADTGTCSGDNPAILCLRPREWLLLSESISSQALMDPIESQVDAAQTSVLDCSDGYAVFRLAGAAAPWLLSKLSCLDFPGALNLGSHCARTKMGHTAVTVHYHQLLKHTAPNPFVFDLIFDRSIARYLWLLLQESANHANELSMNYGS